MAPDQVQLETIVRDYDALYRAEQERKLVEQADMPLRDESIPQTEEDPEPEYSIFTEQVEPPMVSTVKFETVTAEVPDTPVRQEQSQPMEAEEAAHDHSETTMEISWELPAVVEVPIEAVRIEVDEVADIAFDEEIEQFWRQFEPEQFDPVTHWYEDKESPQTLDQEQPVEFVSDFSAEEATELDEMLGFDVIPGSDEIVRTESTQEVEQEAVTLTDFVKLVYAHIEAMPEEESLNAAEAAAELEIIEALVAEKIGETVDEQGLEALGEELFEHAERLLVLMGREPDEKMVKRFVERIIMSELQKHAAAAETVADEGTHERKLFEDDLLWLGVDVGRSLAKIVGERTLRLLRVQESILQP